LGGLSRKKVKKAFFTRGETLKNLRGNWKNIDPHLDCEVTSEENQHRERKREGRTTKFIS